MWSGQTGHDQCWTTSCQVAPFCPLLIARVFSGDQLLSAAGRDQSFNYDPRRLAATRLAPARDAFLPRECKLSVCPFVCL